MNFLDFFAGVGGFRFGLERAGGVCKGFAEIDTFARQSYKAIHNTEGECEWHDIKSVTDHDLRRFRGTIDLISGGFPCQAFSIAGKRMGFNESRGTLFFHIARAAKEIQPRYILLENVKGLLSHDQGKTFTVILNTLQELGYGHIEWGIFNSKYWSVPQNRERIFIVAELTGEPQRPYLLDLLLDQEIVGVQTRLRDVLESNVDEKYYLSEEKTKALVAKLIAENPREESIDPIMLGMIDVNGHDYLRRVYGVDGVSNTLCTMQGGGQEPKIAEPFEVRAVQTPSRAEKKQNGRRIKDNDEPMYTLTTEDKHGILTAQYDRKNGIGKELDIAVCLSASDWRGMNRNQAQNAVVETKPYYRIRKLTPLECWRLQGFSDESHERARLAGVSDSQRYKQAGNSVTVNVVEAIGRAIMERMTGGTE